MYVEHHPLVKDFPEMRDALHELRLNDTRFARMADAYEELDKQICRIESGAELIGEDALTALKQERVGLKDDLARQLKRASGQCCGCGNGCRG
ncbi:YdcH family protein [Pseudomonas sp. TTU2014-080ASC]|jgi:uncharacterized protein YdcH (DUF465 family)|uniref:YdcH family protein n=1 Tax=Pseudomonas sp. TTU2014-080ASC TaxID=1729724 RepID=UPI0007188ECD|nr:DUF465 domain-containing protein [Pseudomonas sp. TTU2014-080ASC]KRW62866.1 GTP-binding protein [Pseudomonas sp. TTU2014-080ASC]